MDYQVVLSPSARKDLREIVRYISADAPRRALAFGQFLISNTKVLAQNPKMGHTVPEFDDPEIREFTVRKYRIIYRVDHASQKVKIVRFWHRPEAISICQPNWNPFKLTSCTSPRNRTGKLPTSDRGAPLKPTA